VIHYELDGEPRRHFPDVLVQTRTYRELWEVKELADAQRPETVKRTELLKLALPTHGHIYRLVLAEDLAREPRLTNVKRLLKHGRREVPILIREQVRQIITHCGGLTWGAVLDGKIDSIDVVVVSKLLLNGFLHFDLNAPLLPSTVLQLADGIDKDMWGGDQS
jgi:hypothetical protein